jgi:magnesium chelatase subunit H
VLHFGTHGALEFMPGKQAGMSGKMLAGPADRRCAEHLPLRLQQSVRRHHRQAPRRGDADQLSDAAHSRNAGLYKGLNDLKASIERWRGMDETPAESATNLAALIQAQAAELDLADPKTPSLGRKRWDARRSSRSTTPCWSSNTP